MAKAFSADGTRTIRRRSGGAEALVAKLRTVAKNIVIALGVVVAFHTTIEDGAAELSGWALDGGAGLALVGGGVARLRPVAIDSVAALGVVVTVLAIAKNAQIEGAEQAVVAISGRLTYAPGEHVERTHPPDSEHTRKQKHTPKHTAASRKKPQAPLTNGCETRA
jgi:hypothetical protein